MKLILSTGVVLVAMSLAQAAEQRPTTSQGVQRAPGGHVSRTVRPSPLGTETTGSIDELAPRGGDASSVGKRPFSKPFSKGPPTWK